MSRKKTPRPLMAVKHDFVDSLDAFIQAAVMLHQAVTSLISMGAVTGTAANSLQERADAFERAFLTEHDTEQSE